MATTTITLKNGDLPSLNVLLRLHWSKRAKMKETLCWKVREQTVSRHPNTVRITFARFALQLMDWDNFAGSFKLVGDALHGLSIIKDDKPDIVKEFIPKQEKVLLRKQEKIVITIEDI